MADTDAATRLYETYRPGVYATCLALLGSPEDAADATHEVFARALPVLDKLDHPNAWLQTAARHHCVDLLRRRRLAERVGCPGWGGERAWPNPADLVVERDEAASAMARLPERERRVLAFVALSDATVAEAASFMGLTYAAAVQLISRARRRVSQLGQLPSALVAPRLARMARAVERSTAPRLIGSPGVPRGARAGSVVMLSVSLLCSGAHGAPSPRPVGAMRVPRPAAPAAATPGSANLLRPLPPEVAALRRHIAHVAGRSQATVHPACTPDQATAPIVVWTHSPYASSQVNALTDPAVNPPEIELTEGTMRTIGSGASAKLVIRIGVVDMSFAQPATSAWWTVYWDQETVQTVANTVFAQGNEDQLSITAAGQPMPPSAGRIVPGPGGYLEMTIPYSVLGITPGTVLHSVRAEGRVYFATDTVVAPDYGAPLDYTAAPAC